jgi:hypothetical protein
MKTLSATRLLSLRQRAQRLVRPPGEPALAPVDVVRQLVGLQAQELRAAQLSMRARRGGSTAAEVERARLEERALVRTWCLRSTLHLIAAEDFGWLLGLLGPVFIAAGRRRKRELGWDEDTGRKGLRLLEGALARNGPLTRDEIREVLRAAGLPAEGQATIHLIAWAALEGWLCQGPERDSEPAFVLSRDWLGQGLALAHDEALAELARRYLRAYAPAGPEDLSAWSGLGKGEARQAWRLIQDELVEVASEGGPAWLLASQAGWLDEPPPTGPIVRLLPRFDTYLLGYASRDLVVEAEYARRVNAGGGIIHPVVLVDGRAVGLWKTERRREVLEVSLEPFRELPDELLP